MMKKTMKILAITLCLMIALSPMIFADTIGGVTVDPNTSHDRVSKVGNNVVGVIKLVGIFISLGAIMVIGVKYMMGSAEEKAEYKKVMIPYLIGAVLLFGASAFADKIATFANSVIK